MSPKLFISFYSDKFLRTGANSHVSVRHTVTDMWSSDAKSGCQTKERSPETGFETVTLFDSISFFARLSVIKQGWIARKAKVPESRIVFSWGEKMGKEPVVLV